jgi:hypothetical protein
MKTHDLAKRPSSARREEFGVLAGVSPLSAAAAAVALYMCFPIWLSILRMHMYEHRAL